MFDMENKETIMKLIDERDPNCFVIPLYVHINNTRYNLWEMNDIDDFSPNTLRVGFGSSRGLRIHSQFPADCIYEFNMITTLRDYNYNTDTDKFYYIFESGNLDESEIRLPIHEQIQTYIQSISDYVKKIVSEKKQALRKQMMEDEDNYISTESD